MADRERDYSHRDVLDKLGITPGVTVAIDDSAATLSADLLSRVLDRVGRGLAAADELADVVLVAADADTDVASLLSHWRTRIEPNGGIWVLTPKRTRPGYVNQSELIPIGLHAGLVDNKVCSASETTSALRFVIRKADRVYS